MTSSEIAPEYLHIMGGTDAPSLPLPVFAELVGLTVKVAAELFEGEPVDWEEVWVELDGVSLADGRIVNLDAPDSPVQRSIRAIIEQS